MCDICIVPSAPILQYEYTEGVSKILRKYKFLDSGGNRNKFFNSGRLEVQFREQFLLIFIIFKSKLPKIIFCLVDFW